MNVVIQKWGNSHGIRIPKVILDSIGFAEDDRVEITTTEDSIVLKKTDTPKHKNITERLEAFYGMSINQINFVEESQEVDFGKPVGDEIW